ncbi:MAG: hypothetical protein ACXWKC_00925 [Xanthobacteraceae bacterium]
MEDFTVKVYFAKAKNLILPSSAVVALTLAACSTAVYAAQVTEAQRKACTPDAFRLCSSDIPNVDKIIVCLKTNRAKLSPDCEAVFSATQTASSTRSIADNNPEWCAFTPGNTDPVEQNWKTWCGPAAR